MTCSSCSWGLPEDQGVWTEDWYASLHDAKNAARSSAAMPVVRSLLEALRSQVASPSIAAEEGLAYLLDVAILLGDAELARSCATHCTRFPLRRWRFQEFARLIVDLPRLRAEILEKDILIAALAAGLELKHLTHRFYDDSVSLAEAVVLSGDAELWHRIEGHQLQLGPWPAHKHYNNMAHFLLEDSGGKVKLSSERMHRAKRAGLALSSFRARVAFRCQCGIGPCVGFSLLEIAIFFGQRDCARLDGSMDIEDRELAPEASLEAMPPVWEDHIVWCDNCGPTSWRFADAWADEWVASLPERRAVAADALCAALQASLHRTASSAGLGLCQAMRSWAHGKSVPAAVVKLVLAFAAARPSLLQALGGREGELPFMGHWWEESMHREGADSQSPQPDAGSQVQGESLGVAGSQPADAAGSSSNDVQAQPDSTSEKESGPDPDTTNDLLTALRNSKNDNPPLSGDGVVIFRLTRKANAEEVNAILFDVTGPLWSLHRRVLDAGCEVAPEWSPIKALFVPLTQPQLQELTHGNIYELGKVHLLALQSDAKLLTESFNEELQRSVRPKLRRQAPRRDDEEAGAPDHEPLLVMMGDVHHGVRTDSNVGYPVYET
ncbi:unnamed protein product [Symbiodinium sp. CCMP2592]|nr:unnamed protein product [Symbiodinium sp. CCMP2592]